MEETTMADGPEKIEMKSGQLNDPQKALVVLHLWAG
jgi:hypothetical protein